MSSPASGRGQSFTSRIALWSARNRKLVAGGWALAVIVALAACSTIEVNDNVEQVPPGESGKAVDVFNERFGEDEDALQEIVTFSHPTLNVDDQAYEDTVNHLMADLRAVRAEKTETLGGTAVTASTRIISSTATHYDIDSPRETSPFVAKNATGGDVTFALVAIEGELDEAMDNIDPLLEAVAEAEAASDGFEILIGGDASLNKQMSEIVEEDFANASLLNLPITFAILMIAFGAVVAAAVPLALAFTAVALAMAVLAVSGRSGRTTGPRLYCGCPGDGSPCCDQPGVRPGSVVRPDRPPDGAGHRHRLLFVRHQPVSQRAQGGAFQGRGVAGRQRHVRQSDRIRRCDDGLRCRRHVSRE